ncbi:hypothetical protein THAOC_04801 [Thalassiosira oceanica]|uniref:Uncharacterized protein n=1 Tax=Thalassiosira oceanica TaxID=159749 RepID=K0T7F7_THAOC|nr:hypothetical protein THAOC_04801 [Thalassiosira oceanica]|eukprot:EJK73565.1 hypothetical protein THAOC_04801 [Thalassiosira oceanica]
MTGPYPPRELVLSVLHGHEGGPTRGERRHFDEFVAGRLRQDRVLARSTRLRTRSLSRSYVLLKGLASYHVDGRRGSSSFERSEVPPNWADLCRYSAESFSEESIVLADEWLSTGKTTTSIGSPRETPQLRRKDTDDSSAKETDQSRLGRRAQPPFSPFGLMPLPVCSAHDGGTPDADGTDSSQFGGPTPICENPGHGEERSAMTALALHGRAPGID